MKSQSDKKASTYNLEALREEWREQTYRIAATEYAENEADIIWEGIITDEGSDKAHEMDAHLAETEGQTLRVIRNAIRRVKAKKIARQTLPRVGQMAAALIIVLSVSLTVAVATSHTVRVRVMEFLINIEEQYAELSLQEDAARSFDIPTEWTGHYYPAKIPEGFSVLASYSGAASSFVDLKQSGKNEVSIHFSEHGEDSFTNLDTEDSVLSAEIINGSPALVAKKDNKISVTWSRDNTYFVLVCYGLAKDQALDIANSVIQIKN